MAEKQKDYLSKAKEADEMAERAPSNATQQAWRKIAENYRVLAKSESGSAK